MNIIAATEKELLGEDEAKLMNTWLTIRGELLGSSRKTNTYLVNCMKYLETQKHAFPSVSKIDKGEITPEQSSSLTNNSTF
jgi:hypothetical protein